MKLTTTVQVNMKDREAQEKILTASLEALRDVTVEIANAVVKGSPWRTGHNRRSIRMKVGKEDSAPVTEGINVTEDFNSWQPEDLNELQAAVFSTSGYGGYLETGTSRMAARPYFKPALDEYFTRENVEEKLRKHLK